MMSLWFNTIERERERDVQTGPIHTHNLRAARVGDAAESTRLKARNIVPFCVEGRS